jgi:hypothetical protein
MVAIPRLVVLGVAAGTLLLAACGDDDSESPSPTSTAITLPSATLGATPTPTSHLGLTLDEYQGLPRPVVVVNGIILGPSELVAGPFGPPCGVNDAYGTSGEQAVGTRLELAPSWLPDSRTSVVAEATKCTNGRVIASTYSFELAAIDGVTPRIDVVRSLAAYPVNRTDVPAEYWQAVTIGSFPAAMAGPFVDGKYRVEVLVWDPEGVQTLVQSFGGDPDAVLEFTMGLFPEAPATPTNGDGGPDDPGLPATTRSGITAVDTVIAAIVDGEAAALAALLHPTGIPCSYQQQPDDAPPCPLAVLAGTPQEVVPVANCELAFPGGRVGVDPLQLLLASHPRLYAVYRAGTGEPWPDPVSAQYGVIFVGDGHVARGVLLGVSESGIAGVHYGCGLTNPAAFLEGVPVDDWLLTPRK